MMKKCLNMNIFRSDIAKAAFFKQIGSFKFVKSITLFF
ncbi:hypothetical protein COI_0491 [Mannheimia haemolytica serotype A2 str. OVINE]|nr:hypothetical protein MHH_c06800 [Mannheimia haemolytica M42548]EEY10885.1 hypothetical protein COI_0491 [Mannheimia haemolytica serotype A2 str. OVINE]EEY13611.1 hypothetical protein COK_0264 [Mannheimia haemolytica serotype A2 str. BOVINE]